MNITNERIKFENGPAKETIASSLKGFLNLDMFMGTGLAQPISAIPVVSEKRGIKYVPMRSACLNGFKVSRPRFFAVSSPNFEAESAWANSCTLNEIKKIGRKVIKEISFWLI
jgi:hypothetical protein